MGTKIKERIRDGRKIHIITSDNLSAMECLWQYHYMNSGWEVAKGIHIWGLKYRMVLRERDPADMVKCEECAFFHIGRSDCAGKQSADLRWCDMFIAWGERGEKEASIP